MEKIKRFIIDTIHGKNIIIPSNMDKLNPIINICQSIFPNANINPNANTLQLSGNISNQGNIIIDANRIFLDVQDSNDVEQLYKLYSDVLKIFTEKFAVDTFSRVGIRYFIGRKMEGPNLIDSLIKNKFMIPSVEQFGKDLQEIHLGFTTTYNEYKINHNFFKLCTQNININLGNVETKVDYFLLYDIDFYKESQTNYENINGVFDDARKQIKIFSKEYFSSIGGE